MQIPAEMRRRPPAEALAWVERSVGPGARIVRVRRLRNAWAAAMHAVAVEHRGARHQLVLRRWARTDFPPDIGVVENEAAALTLLADSAIAAPRLLAADKDGAEAGVPAVLMTRVPGRNAAAPADPGALLDGLVATLHAVHAVPVAPGTLNYFRPWGLDTVTSPPAWSTRPDVWKHAIDIAHAPQPAHDRVLLHRDFHPGNVLWQRGRVSGVVDWTHACRGPAAADVAHCRLNLALLADRAAADELARRYGPLDDLAWHDVADAVSLGGPSPPDDWRWADAGRNDITTATMIGALDDFLAAAVSRIG